MSSRGATGIEDWTEPLKEACRREFAWPEVYVDRVLKAYIQFLNLKKIFEDWNGTILAAPPLVEQMWQRHVLATNVYHLDCLATCQHAPIQYDGYGTKLATRERRVSNTQIAVRARSHHEDYDSEIWNFDAGTLLAPGASQASPSSGGQSRSVPHNDSFSSSVHEQPISSSFPAHENQPGRNNNRKRLASTISPSSEERASKKPNGTSRPTATTATVAAATSARRTTRQQANTRTSIPSNHSFYWYDDSDVLSPTSSSDDDDEEDDSSYDSGGANAKGTKIVKGTKQPKTAASPCKQAQRSKPARQQAWPQPAARDHTTISSDDSVSSSYSRHDLSSDEEDDANRGDDSPTITCKQTTSSKRLEASWKSRFEQLRKFRMTHGHVNIPSKYNQPLADWAKYQRQRYEALQAGKPSAMTQERIEALESIGFRWSVWDQHFHEMEQFKYIHGHVNVPTNYKENKVLGIWIRSQRKLYKHKPGQFPLTQDRIAALNNLGFQWKGQRGRPKTLGS